MKQIFLSIILFFGLTTTYLHAQYVWRHKACLPVGTYTNCFGFASNGNGYIMAEVGNTMQVWKYNPNTNGWTQLNNYPGATFGPSIFVVNDTAYAGLGKDSAGQYQNTFWKYSAATDHWTAVANFPGNARYLSMSFAIGSKGYTGCGKGLSQYNDFYEYDPSANVWTQKSSFPGVVRQAGLGIAQNGYGYMGLGFGNGVVLSDIYKFNASANNWSRISDLAGGAREGVVGFVINDTIYVSSGGHNPDGTGVATAFYGDCWRYNNDDSSWTEMANYECIAPSRVAFAQFSLGGHGYVIAGHNSDGYYKDVLEFGPKDESFIFPTPILGNDTVYTGAFNRTLSVADSCAVWSTGYIGSSISIQTNGVYWVRYEDKCGLTTDTIVIGSTVGLAHLIGAKGMMIYPNPCINCNHFVVNADENMLGAELNIYDLNGQKVAKTMLSQVNQVVDFDFGPGVYFVEAKKQNSLKILKLVRQ